VNPDHLFLGTAKDNMQDAVQKGRIASGDRSGRRLHPESYQKGEKHWTKLNPEKILKGEGHPRSKLKKFEVLEIRRLRKEGMKVTKIAEMFSIASQTVSEITLRKRWTHI